MVSRMMAPVPLLVITGPCGVGKTTAMFACSAALQAWGVAHGCIDMDAVRHCHPSPPGDAFQAKLGLRNLAAMWPNYAATGARRLVLADVVESNTQRAEYEDTIPGATITIARLSASRPTIAECLRGRESGASLEWHLHRSAELIGIMEREAIGDFLVATDGLAPQVIAEAILRHWKQATGPI